MVGTALLIAEVNVNVICSQGTPGVGLIALAEQVIISMASHLLPALRWVHI